ncbi:MAG: hypothetical protein IPF90_04510 [Actinomycetales bacterium]|nr:hypothetical protein [Candidatus Phosphoribacter baldrii]
MQDFADRHAPGVWAIEGTGSYGSGLTTALLEHGQWVVEIDRPTRPARRDRAKSDDLDAVRAAREALGRDHLALPRARGDREALRVLTTAPCRHTPEPTQATPSTPRNQTTLKRASREVNHTRPLTRHRSITRRGNQEI